MLFLRRLLGVENRNFDSRKAFLQAVSGKFPELFRGLFRGSFLGFPDYYKVFRDLS